MQGTQKAALLFETIKAHLFLPCLLCLFLPVLLRLLLLTDGFTVGDFLLPKPKFYSPVNYREKQKMQWGLYPGDFIITSKPEFEVSAIHPCTLYKQDNTLCSGDDGDDEHL